jgi:hypothetical protein
MALNTKQGWNWIASHQSSGNNIWISFSGGTPVVVPSSIDFFVANGESGTSFSDDNGNLFLVSDGTTIKTSGGTTIVSGLSGSAFSMQSATILQSPYSSDTYYVLTVGVGAAFTEGGYGNPNQALTYNTLKYTGGTSPFFQVLNTNVEIGNRSNLGGDANYPNPIVGFNGYGYAEVLTTALHQNGDDIWVITPNWGRNQIHSFLINSSGISGTPYTSTTTQVLQGFNNYGQIKPSPDYTKIAMVLGDSNASQVQTANRPAVSIFDFNRSTGELTNETVLLGNTGYTIYDTNGTNPEVFDVGDVLGCEFSPDGNYLYVSEFQSSSGGKLLQFVLTASTPTSASTVTASTNYATFKSTGGSSLGTLHLAVDEKIYFTDRGTTRLYNVDNPNNPLSAVTIDNSDYGSGGGVAFNYGLPNIPLFANLPPVVTGCTDENFCFNTSFPSLSAYSGNYTKTITFYNGKNIYSGGTISAATVFYDGNKWCLSTSLGGSCILSGKQPCSTDCPDICDSVFDVSSCPTPTPTTTPTPTPTITPTPSVTMTNTPTQTNTPTTTQTNTPTPSTSRPAAVTFTISVTRTSPSPTPTQTPTSTPIPTRTVSSSGTSIYEIVNSPFICPGGNKVLTDCATGDEYVVSENISITGTTITRGTIFSAYINGISTCVTLTDYTDNSSNVVYGGGIAQFASCTNCLTPPTPTPTPSVTPTNTVTPTQTPTQTPTRTVTPTPTLPAIGILSLSATNDTCESYTASAITANRFFGTINVVGSGATGSNYRYSINSGTTFSSTTSFTGLSSSTYGVVVRDNLTSAQTSVTPITITRASSANTFSAITFSWSRTPVFVSSAATPYSVDITGTTYPGSAITIVYSGTATLSGLTNVPSGVTWNGSFNDQWGMSFNTQTGFFSGMTGQPWQVIANVVKNGVTVTSTTRSLATATRTTNPTGGTCTDSGSTIFNQVRRASNGNYLSGDGWRLSNLAPTSVSSGGFLPFTFVTNDSVSVQITYSGTVLSVPNLPGGCSQTLTVSSNILATYFSTASNMPSNNNTFVSTSGLCYTLSGTRIASNATQAFFTYTVT